MTYVLCYDQTFKGRPGYTERNYFVGQNPYLGANEVSADPTKAMTFKTEKAAEAARKKYGFTHGHAAIRTGSPMKYPPHRA